MKPGQRGMAMCHIPYFSLSSFYLLRRLLRLLRSSSDFTFYDFIPYLSFTPFLLITLFSVSMFHSPSRTTSDPHSRYYPFHISSPFLPFIILCFQDRTIFRLYEQFSLSPYNYSEYVYNQL